MKLKYLLFIATLLLVLNENTAFAQYKGNATFYGTKFHGRRTSDGSTYHKDSLTCAHRTLPFGTLLRVRNTKNGREVVVKVTDRGPFRKGAIVDLSLAAAKAIDMVRAGVVPVEVAQVNSREYPLRAPENKSFILPELQLLDPATGEYYTASQWAERGQNERERAQASARQRNDARYLTKAKQPRWRVLNNQLTAKSSLPNMDTTLP